MMSGRRVVLNCGRCVQPINQTGIFIDIIKQEPALVISQIDVLGIEVFHHENGNTAAQAGRHLQVDQGPGR